MQEFIGAVGGIQQLGGWGVAGVLLYILKIVNDERRSESEYGKNMLREVIESSAEVADAVRDLAEKVQEK